MLGTRSEASIARVARPPLEDIQGLPTLASVLVPTLNPSVLSGSSQVGRLTAARAHLTPSWFRVLTEDAPPAAHTSPFLAGGPSSSARGTGHKASPVAGRGGGDSSHLSSHPALWGECDLSR